MTGFSLFYELSPEADDDLAEIFDYTVTNFGIDQAVKYLGRVKEVFTNLCGNPKPGKERNEIRKGLRSISVESHVIFYRIMPASIRIIRVLHASRDVIRFLPPQD